MAEYELNIFLASAFGEANVPPTTVAGQDAATNDDGSQWDIKTDVEFFVDPVSIETVIIDDGDAAAEGEVLNDGEGNANQIVTTSTIPGFVPEGTRLENEYEVTLTDGTDEYRLVALSNGSQILAYTFEGAWPAPDALLSVVPNSSGGDQSMVPCFARGTLVETPDGPVAVEDLAAGMLVTTRDRGAQPLRWIGSRRIGRSALEAAPNLRPIRIRAGALGEGTPSRDLVVSPQHRVLVRSRIAQRMFGTSEVLVAAKQLLQIDGIEIARDLDAVEYFHFLFDQHEVVVSNGAETESLHTGPEALKAVGVAARNEIFAIFPELRTRTEAARQRGARLLASGRRARKLAVRHVQHNRHLVQ